MYVYWMPGTLPSIGSRIPRPYRTRWITRREERLAGVNDAIRGHVSEEERAVVVVMTELPRGEVRCLELATGPVSGDSRSLASW